MGRCWDRSCRQVCGDERAAQLPAHGQLSKKRHDPARRPPYWPASLALGLLLIGWAPPHAGAQGTNSGTPQTVPVPESWGKPVAKPGVMGASIAGLFAKGTVTGADLIGTLQALQAEIRQQRSAQAMASMMASVDSSVDNVRNGNLFGVSGIAIDALAAAATALAKQSVSTVATRALDEYLQSMIDDPQALSSELITLPSGQDLTEVQAKRVLTIAALVVGARVTAKVLDRARKDFESLKVDYGKLIDKREQAAKLLFTAIGVRGKSLAVAADPAAQAAVDQQGLLQAGLSADDLRFIEKDLGKLSVTEFSKDMAAQNLALSYLGKVQPDAFTSYRVEADDVVRRTKGYLRTMTGIAAFGALAVNFSQALSEVMHERQLASLMQSLPLMKDFIVAAAPLGPVAVSTALKGVELSTEESGVGGFFSSVFHRKKAFVMVNADKAQDMSGASEVFSSLKQQSEASELFRGALFRSDAPGLLQRIAECDRAEAGRMFDAAVQKSDREAFARTYFAGAEDKASGFSFLNAFEDSNKPGAPEQNLALQLLAEDHRGRSSDTTLALAKVQQTVSEQYQSWGDAQLMRLIFANREGQARHATLYLGPTHIRPVPSPEAVFAYETAAESCKKLVVQTVARPRGLGGGKDAGKGALKDPGKEGGREGAKESGKEGGRPSAKEAAKAASHAKSGNKEQR